jgi:hypothetical protein
MRTVRTSSAVRTSTLIALGAFAVHQLRYLAAYGGDTGAALGAQGHAYLAALVPPLVIAAASAVLGTLVAAALASPPARPRRRAAGWWFCAVALLAVFATQELVEGAFAAGHPAGVTGLLGHGGWLAVPIAILVGRAISFLLGGLEIAERRLARAPLRPRGRAPSTPRLHPSTTLTPLACGALAFGLAGRPPPSLRR